MEIRNYFVIPVYQGSLCLYLAIGFYPLQQIVFVMILLYFIRYFAIIWLNENKNSLINQIASGEKAPGLVVARSIALKIVASTWFSIVMLVTGYIVMVVIYVIVFASYGFVCRFQTLVILKIINNVELILIYCLIIVTLLVDAIGNANKIFRQCKIIDYVFFSDPYWFRVQIILFLPFMVYSLLSQIHSLVVANTYTGIVVNHTTLIILDTINAHILLILDVFFPLVITIIVYFRVLCAKKGKHDEFEVMFKNQELREIFARFSKKEFSIENYLCWNELNEYLTTTKREAKADHIFATYLNGEKSVMEVNLDRKTCSAVHAKSKQKSLGMTCFRKSSAELSLIYLTPTLDSSSLQSTSNTM
jgi:hypothetical protein